MTKVEKEENRYDCAIIGGGAAGLAAAIMMSRSGLKVIIIEHTKRIGSKILQTGNGKCNFTNLILNQTCYQNEQARQVMEVIERFNNQDAISFFESIGVFHRERNGYVYPHSDTATSLQNALRLELEHLKVRVSTEFHTKEIKRVQEEKGYFQIVSDAYTYEAEAVLMATGSKASPKSGSDGSGYPLASAFGHKIHKPLPALVQLKSSSKACKEMAGVRSQGTVDLYVNGDLIASDTGEIQYTDYGISGIPVFQISRHAVKAIDAGKKSWITIDMMPDYTEEQLRIICEKNIEIYGYRAVEQFFEGMINKKLILAICATCGIDSKKKACEIGQENLFLCVSHMKQFRMELSGFKDFAFAQVCQGGVILDEINLENMMSKKVSGVFFAGEIVDVDGKCGGYNLQWAWSSAAVAASGIKNYTKQ